MNSVNDPIGIFILVMIIIIPIIVIVFYFIFRYLDNKSNETIYESSNRISEIRVDINERQVYVQTSSILGYDSQRIYKLEDFIYMISLNPDSKQFRELLKLINNKSSNKLIEEKFLSIKNKMIPFIASFENKKFLSVASLQEYDKTNKIIQIQVSESNITPNKKEEFINFLETPIIKYRKDEILSAFSKEVKDIKTKGWNLVKITNVSEILDAEKEYFLNSIQLIKIKILLEKYGYKPMLSHGGELFFLLAGTRKTNNISINRELNNIISSILPTKNKAKLNILNLNIDDLKILSTYENNKNISSLNKAFIKISLLSELENNSIITKKMLKELDEYANELDAQANKLIKEAKDSHKKSFIVIEKNISNRGFRNIIEFDYNIPKDRIRELMKYSIRHKNELLKLLIEYANKNSKKYSEDLTSIMINSNDIPLVSKIVSKIKRSKNFYIAIFENSNIYNSDSYINAINIIKGEGYELIQLIRDVNEGSLNILRNSKPEYVLLIDRMIEQNDLEQKLSVQLKKIELTKPKNTKILKLK